MIVHSTYYLCINMLYVSFTRPLPSLATVPSLAQELRDPWMQEQLMQTIESLQRSVPLKLPRRLTQLIYL